MLYRNDQNEFVVKAKVDDEMIALSKLVAGQRNNKKKKSKPKARSFRQAPLNQFRFAKFEPKPPLVNRANSYSNSHSFQDVKFLVYFLNKIINWFKYIYIHIETSKKTDWTT